jgi:ribosomal protein S18 acetylase RimI-like enzyme
MNNSSDPTTPGATALEIRPFLETDAPGVTALWHEVFPEDPPHHDPAAVMARKTAYQRELFFVGLLEGQVVGTVLAGYDGVRGWVYKMAVRRHCQRLGIATALMRHAEEALAALGCPKVNLQVRATNQGVIAFYRKLGYAVEERVSMGKMLAGEP